MIHGFCRRGNRSFPKIFSRFPHISLSDPGGNRRCLGSHKKPKGGGGTGVRERVPYLQEHAFSVCTGHDAALRANCMFGMSTETILGIKSRVGRRDRYVSLLQPKRDAHPDLAVIRGLVFFLLFPLLALLLFLFRSCLRRSASLFWDASTILRDASRGSTKSVDDQNLRERSSGCSRNTFGGSLVLCIWKATYSPSVLAREARGQSENRSS